MDVILDNKKVSVVLHRKKIKNIYFRFDEEMNLVVSVSKYISEKEILKLIEKNRSSLTKMFLKNEKKQEKAQEFWYLGRKYDIITNEAVTEIDFQDGQVICKNEEMLNRFLKQQVKKIFTDEVEEMKKVISPPPFTLKFRKMKTRWGVCNYQLKTITLNTELIRYKKENLRYVIVHEMCHFYHHNHGKEFWNMVSYYYPNYKEARKELRD